MEADRVNQLPVVSNGRLLGIVTDRDVRDAFPSVFDHRRPAKKAADAPEDMTVESVMTSNVLTLGAHDSVADAARLMRRERIGAVPIVDAGHVVGIITRSDVLDAFVALAIGVEHVPTPQDAFAEPM
jgi:acetoin utilization protein AcuB